MTVPVPDQLEYISDANGMTKDFSYPKRFLQKDEIVVALRNADGIDTPQILGMHYTIAGNSWPTGGTVSFIIAPLAPNKVVLYRMTQAKQTVRLANNQRNDAPSVELQLDRLTMGLQDRGARGELTALGLIAEIAARKAGDAALNQRVTQETQNRIAADSLEREERMSGDDALAQSLDVERSERSAADANERFLRIAGDKALASIIGQAGQIEVPLYDTAMTVTLATIKPTVQSLRTAGFYAPGDGGAALYKRVDTKPTHEGKLKSLDGAWWELGEITVQPKMLGARGDGVTDDSFAIQAANDTGLPVYFTDGVYSAANLDMTVGWHMSPNAKLLYNGGSYGQLLQCTVNNLLGGDINIDLNGQEPRTGFLLTGSENCFGKLAVENAVSSDTPWVVRSAYITGSYNVFDHVYMKDLVITGNTNDSTPQGLVLSGSATGNIFSVVSGKNIRSLVVENSSGRNQFGTIHATDCKDNGAYFVGPECRAAVGTVIYDGDDNALGFRHGASPTIGQVIVLHSGATSLFFGDCGDVTIGDIFVPDNSMAILHLNVADTGHIKVNSIRGKLRNSSVIAMPADFGPVKFLTIGSLDVQVYLDAATTISTRSICRFDAAQGVDFGVIKIDVYLVGYVPTAPFYVRLNPALKYASIVEAIRFAVWEADGVTPHTSNGVFVQDVLQANLTLGEGIVAPTGNLRPYSYSSYQPGRIMAGIAPTAGTWRKGAMVWAESPTVTTRGWMCAEAGTPGTWVTF